VNKILITGGAGFVGGHLTEELLKLGHRVVVLDDESATSSEKFNWFKEAENHKFSILEKDKLEELFKIKFDYVVHLAAETKVQLSIDDPEKCYRVNVLGTLNILELSRKYNVKRVIMASTSAIYGMNPSPHTTTQGPDCLNPYAASKICDEELCKLYSRLYQLETVCFRFFNIYGERMPCGGPYAPVVAIFNKQKQNGEKLTITGDGEQRRDFIYVKDVVSALIASLTSKDTRIVGGLFNLGTGKNYSVNQIAKMVGGKHVYIAPRDADARETLADIELTKNILDWHPKMEFDQWLRRQNDNS